MEQTIIFDMDGTLLDSMPVWRGAAAQLLRSHGFQPKADLQQRLAALELTEGCRYLMQEYGFSITPKEIHKSIFEIVAEGYLKVVPKPGAVRVLQQLSNRGAKMCVVSSTPQELLVPVLTRLNLMQYFAFADSCRPGLNKDKPDCYVDAMHRLGETEPGKTAVFEDACYAVCTAAQAGFVVYAIEDDAAKDDAEIMRRMAKQYLQSWNQLALD